MTQEKLKNQILQTMNDYQIPEFFKEKIINIIDKYLAEQEDDGSCCYSCDEDDEDD